VVINYDRDPLAIPRDWRGELDLGWMLCNVDDREIEKHVGNQAQ